jgi:guanine deaminase
MNPFMNIALQEARTGVEKQHGGPFGAVVVFENRIISRAHNQVLLENDPTAHAEIVAIRKAAKAISHFHLTGYELYTTCEPCPMCLAAILWARIKTLYFGCSRFDAAEIGFKDEEIYCYFDRENASVLQKEQIGRQACLKIFDFWQKQQNKKLY